LTGTAIRGFLHSDDPPNSYNFLFADQSLGKMVTDFE
jgi:hypothetical protein